MNAKGGPSREAGPSRPVLRRDPGVFGPSAREPDRRRVRLLAAMLCAGAHVALLGVFFWPRAAPAPPRPDTTPLLIAEIDVSKPPPPDPPDLPQFQAEEHPSAAEPAPPRFAISASAPVVRTATADTSDLLSDSQLAGMAGADEGGGGGCNTARLVQQALRTDPLVHAAVEDAHRLGKAVMLWNGDWVQSGGQDGKGLSAVREAIVWELAFAPQDCRNKPMRGPVLLSLADGRTRFAIGAGDWRWSDLLHVHAGATAR